MTRYRLFALAVLGISTMILPSCHSEPFLGGVAVSAYYEAEEEVPSAQIGMPGVPDSGNDTNGDTFVGVTDSNGIDQHPYAPTDITWTVAAGLSVVNAACPDGLNTAHVPATGGSFNFICLL